MRRYNDSIFRLPMLLAAVVVASQPTVAAPAQTIEETIVFGHPAVRRAEDLAQPYVVLRGTDLDSRRAGNLGDTVGREVGVQNASFGVTVGRPVIRGLDGARVRTLIDSLDALDASTVSGDHAVTIEPFAAEQIEILKGPSTVLYGSGAIGGIVNVVTGRMPSKLGEEAIEGRVEVRAGDAADERTAAARLSGTAGRFAWHVDATRRENDDVEIPGNARSKRQQALDAIAREHEHDDEELEATAEGDEEHAEEDLTPQVGRLRNSDGDGDGFGIGGAWLGETLRIGAAISTFDTEYGLPGSIEGDVRIDLEQDRYDAMIGIADALPGIDDLSLRAAINRYEHVEIEPSGEIATAFENDGIDLRLLAEHAPIGDASGAIGLQFSRREFSAVGAEAFVPPSDTEVVAIFASEAIDAGAVRWQFGARYESVEVEADVDDFDFDAFSLTAGAITRLGDGHSIAVQIDRSARAPVAEELLSDGPHLATRSFEVGNPDLEEEIATNLSVTYAYGSDSFDVVLSGYYTAFEDFIYLVATGEEEDELPVRVHLQDDATLSGLEAEATWHLHGDGPTSFDIAVFGDLVRGTLDDGDDDLPRIAPWRAGVALRGKWHSVAGELAYTRVGKQDDVAAFEPPTDGYALVSLDLTWHTDIGASHLELFLRGSNLLDEEARNHLSLIKEFAPLPGRAWLGGVRLTF